MRYYLMTDKQNDKRIKRLELSQQNRNTYCSASCYCPHGRGFKTALFLFLNRKNRFGIDDMMTYIDWFMLSSRLAVEQVDCDIYLEAFQQIRKLDPHVDWNTVDRPFFDNLCLRS